MDRELIPFDIKLNGRCRPAEDPADIGTDFRSLKNMRYTDNHPKGIGGMTKIVTMYSKVKEMFHFKKESPSESHLLVTEEAEDGSFQQVQSNDTAIPNAGSMTGVAEWIDSAGWDKGRYSYAPDGNVAYCNGVDTCIWGGDETRCAAFVNKSINNDFEYDFTEEVKNTLQDSENVATMFRYNETIDSNTLLLCHLDNAATDTTGRHTPSPLNITYDTITKKVGTHSAYFNGTNSYINLGTSSDFSFASGNYTLEFWMNLAVDGNSFKSVYRQWADANNWFFIYVYLFGGRWRLYALAKVGGVTRLNLSTQVTYLPGEWAHVALCGDGTNHRLYVNGQLQGIYAIGDGLIDYNINPIFGFPDSGAGLNYFKGYLDEIRISNTCRYTTNFTPRTLPFGAYNILTLYAGLLRPAKGFKAYIGVANATTASLSTVEYGTETGWNKCANVSDGTSSSGKTLAQTGWITFNETKSDAKLTFVGNRLLYWYKLTFTNVDESATIYHMTADCSFQPIKDIWDGELRPILYYAFYKNGDYNDFSVNVATDNLDSNNSATYAKINAITNDKYQYLGFLDQMVGVSLSMVEDSVNLVTSFATVEYWNGKSWVQADNVQDGTREDGITYNKSGFITWSIPEGQEKPSRPLSDNSPLAYYYRIRISDTTSADVKIYNIGGIPRQKKISSYKFPMMADERLWLCGDMAQDKNSVLISNANTSQVFNGKDSVKLYFGDDTELVAGIPLFSRANSNFYTLKIFWKKNSMWAVQGMSSSEYRVHPIIASEGCSSPYTVSSFVANVNGAFDTVVIWQGANGIYLYNNTSVIPIHQDIKHLFDPNDSRKINPDMIGECRGFYDPNFKEYHFLCATGSETTLNEEWVFDVIRTKWYQVDRVNPIQIGCIVTDTNGNNYNYGYADLSYPGAIYRLENGTDFDGEDISHDLWFGDIPLHENSVMFKTKLDRFKLVTKSKSNESLIIASHYAEGDDTGEEIVKFEADQTGKRLSNFVCTNGFGPYTYHSLRFQVTTDDQTVGFEPIALGGFYKLSGEDMG